MSYVNLKTKKIVGAKKGTIKYYHEQGHLEYNNSPLGIRNSYRQWFYMYFAITSMILGQFSIVLKYSSIIFIFLSWYYFFYEEIYCWNYASKKVKGGFKLNGMEKK